MRITNEFEAIQKSLTHIQLELQMLVIGEEGSKNRQINACNA